MNESNAFLGSTHCRLLRDEGSNIYILIEHDLIMNGVFRLNWLRISIVRCFTVVLIKISSRLLKVTHACSLHILPPLWDKRSSSCVRTLKHHKLYDEDFVRRPKRSERERIGDKNIIFNFPSDSTTADDYKIGLTSSAAHTARDKKRARVSSKWNQQRRNIRSLMRNG